MKLIAQVKLLPTPEQHDALKRTLETANHACNLISETAWETGTFRQYSLHKLVYHPVRAETGLSAQMVVRCIAKVADAYKLDRKTPRTFKPHGSIAYDDRILSWQLADQTVSIWTVAGRISLPFVGGRKQLELLTARQGETDLVYRNGEFYLFAACTVEEPAVPAVDEFLGVDLGVTNIAADSDGETYSSGHLNGLRKRHRKIRKRLQKKGTRSARRLLQKRRRQEARFAKDVNHRIAKRIVAKAEGTARGIALEDLTGIRARTTVRKSQRSQQHSWAFHDLRTKIESKARLRGVPVVLVDPRNTSRTCPLCGCVDKRNRPAQPTFACVSCGYSAHADTVAATNLGRRAAVNQPNAASLAA